MKVNVQLRKLVVALLVAGVATMSVSPVVADDAGSLLRGAAGGVVGGTIGNQVGNGKGRAATTAVGAAAGTMIASGCKVSAKSGVGALLGGLLGYQVGGGNGKNVMAGVGASLGAWLASDCSPVASAAAPVALDEPAFRFNGLSMQPVSGFPMEAFRGVPPILTTDDLEAAREVSVRLAAGAKESYQAGDSETALLKMYWAKKIGLAALAVSSSSLDAVASLTSNAGRTQATVPPKTLVVLPAYDAGAAQSGGDKVAAWLSGENRFARLDWKNSFQVADNGASGLFSALRGVVNAVSGSAGSSQSTQVAAAPSASSSGRPNLTPELAGLREGQPLQLANGIILVKQQGNLTAYNPGNAALGLPLDTLDFLPRAPELSAGRKAAAGLMKAMSQNTEAWSFNVYGAYGRGFSTAIEQPNRVVDRLIGGKTVAYLDGNGAITSSKAEGELAFKQDANFRTAASVLDSKDRSPEFKKFNTQCGLNKNRYTDVLGGQYADTTQAICFTGTYSAPVQVVTRTFWLGEAGKAAQTLASMIEDQQFLNAMRAALVGGKLTSDVLSALGTPVGNVESALQCFGQDSLTQMAAVEGVRANYAQPGNRTKGVGTGYSKARVLGWEPEPAEWGLDRVANCIGVVPLAGGVVAGGVKAAGNLGRGVIAALPSADKLETAFKLFNTPTSFGKYSDGVRVASELFPENATAARFMKSAYDAVMSGANMVQLKGDFMEVGGLLASR